MLMSKAAKKKESQVTQVGFASASMKFQSKLFIAIVR